MLPKAGTAQKLVIEGGKVGGTALAGLLISHALLRRSNMSRVNKGLLIGGGLGVVGLVAHGYNQTIGLGLVTGGLIGLGMTAFDSMRASAYLQSLERGERSTLATGAQVGGGSSGGSSGGGTTAGLLPEPRMTGAMGGGWVDQYTRAMAGTY